MTRISPNMVEVYKVFTLFPAEWLTNHDVVGLARLPATHRRTIQAITTNLTNTGVIECLETFPAFKYRLSPDADKKRFVAKLKKAAEVHAP